MGFRERAFDTFLKSMSGSHRLLLRLTGGRLLATTMGMKTVDLQTIGRKSGLPRWTMLTAPIFEPDRVVLVASKGGDERHPDWYLNLRANPEIVLRHDGRETRWHARIATPEEKAQLWPQVVSTYKGYASYQRRTTREIPLVICEPRD